MVVNTDFALIPIALFVAMVVALGIVVGGVVMVVRAFLRRGEAQRLSEQEAATLRQLAETARRMEERVVNLETILLERSGAERESRRY